MSNLDDDLAVQHLPLVRQVAHSLRPTPPVTRDDLVGAGQVALLRAARTFNPNEGVPFEPFARQRIRWAMLDEMRCWDDTSRRARRSIRDAHLLLHAHHANPTMEVLTGLGVTADVARHVTGGLRLVSAPVDIDTLADVLPADEDSDPEAVAVRSDTIRRVRAAVAALPAPMRTVVDAAMAGEPQHVTAARMGVSPSRVSQVYATARQRLARALPEAS